MANTEIPAEADLLTLEQAATVLQVSRRTVQRVIEAGELRAVTIAGDERRLLRVTRAELARYIASLEVVQ